MFYISFLCVYVFNFWSVLYVDVLNVLVLVYIIEDKLVTYKLLSIVYLLNEPIDEEMLSFALNNILALVTVK